MAQRDEVGGYLSGKKSQLGVGLLGSPFEQFEGRRFIHPVDEHQHALGPLDVCAGRGDYRTAAVTWSWRSRSDGVTSR
jgi:hypothetical protein